MNATSETGWPKILLIYAVGVLGAMAVSQATPVIGLMAREFHPSDFSQVGLIISLPSLVVALGALAVGWLVDKFGARRWLIVGSLILIAGDFATSAAPSFSWLLATRLLSGVGYVCIAVAAVTMISRTTSGPRRTSALSLWSSFVPMSFIVPFLAAGPILGSGQWRWAFTGHGILLAVLALLAAFVLPEGRLEGIAGARTKGLGRVLRSPWPYVLGLSFGAAACLQSGIVASLAGFLARRYGVSEVLVQSFNTGAMAVNIVGCLAVGRLLNHKMPAWIVGVAGTVISGFGAVVLFVGPVGFGGAIAASWFFTFGSGLLVGMWTLLPQVSPGPECTGATSGLVTQLTLLGVLLGSPLAFATESAATSGPILLFIGGSLLVGLCALPIWLRASAHAHG